MLDSVQVDKKHTDSPLFSYVQNVLYIPRVSACGYDRVTLSSIRVTYTETKKFWNTLQIRIFITETYVQINTEFFNSRCDYNLIQYQILHASLQNFICMERSACHKMFSKGQNATCI